MLRGLIIFILIFQFSFARADIFEQCLNSSGSSIEELQKLGRFLEQDSLAKCLGIQKRGNQSDFWAQEMIGTDLVHQRIKDKNIKLNTVHVGVIDSHWDTSKIKEDYTTSATLFKNPHPLLGYHGTNTVNTLSAKNSNGIASSAHPVLFQLQQVPDIKKNPVSFFNISATNDNTAKMSLVIGKDVDWENLYNKKPIFMSSGNASRTIQDHVTGDAARKIIFVAAVEPSGLATNYSTLSRSVTIMAPAGTPNYDTSVKIESDTFYSGTSAAAPIASGAFSDFVGLTGDLNSDEIKILLDRTSQPSPMKFTELEKDKFGVGILNHYKMFRAAERLAANKNWPKDRSLIDQSATYDFTNEAKELETSAIDLLKSDDCKDKKEGFKKIRESFLLNPTDRNRFVLAYLYRQMGLSDTADYFWNDTKDKLVGSYIKNSVEAYKINRFGSARSEYNRFLEGSYKEIVKKVLPEDAETVRYPSLMLAREPQLTVSKTEEFLLQLDKQLEVKALTLKTNVALDPEESKKNYETMRTTYACLKSCLQKPDCAKNGAIDIKNDTSSNCQRAFKEFALKNVMTIKPAEFRSTSLSILKQLGSTD